MLVFHSIGKGAQSGAEYNSAQQWSMVVRAVRRMHSVISYFMDSTLTNLQDNCLT